MTSDRSGIIYEPREAVEYKRAVVVHIDPDVLFRLFAHMDGTKTYKAQIDFLLEGPASGRLIGDATYSRKEMPRIRIPVDCRVTAARTDELLGRITLRLESREFAPVPVQRALPEVAIALTVGEANVDADYD